MAWYLYLAIIGAGFLAGFINTIAGSGSSVTVPLLMAVGLDPGMANGTNRVAIVLQNMISTSRFKKKEALDTRGAFILGIPAVIGSIIGANIAVNLDKDTMEIIIGIVMLLMLALIILKPNQWLEGTLVRLEGGANWKQILLLFFAGLYGGFIQIGVGVLLLSTLVLGVGYNLVRANAVKVGLILLFTIPALIVFAINGQVNWTVGFVLAIGNMAGAWVAANFAVDKGAEWIRRLLIVIVAGSALKFLGVFDLVLSMFN